MESARLSEGQLDSLLPASNAFIPSLNGFRAVSILIVLVDHATPIKIIPGGFAVSIFFFISGFLITRLLLTEAKNTGRISLLRFYLSRLFRLFPALIVALLFALAVTSFLGHQQSKLAILSVVFYFSNYLLAANNTLLESIGMYHTWSLSVEEHFYLVYPLLMSLALPSLRRAFMIAISAIVAAFLLRLVYQLAWGGVAASYIYTASETRMDFIAYGCLAALICNTRYGRPFIDFVSRPASFWVAIAMIALSLAIRETFFRGTFRYYMQGMALFVVIPAVVFGPNYAWLRTPLNSPLADWIGRISYSLYLFHPAALLLGAAVASTIWPGSGLLPSFVGAVLGIGLSVVLAAASYYVVETPFLNLRKRVLAILFRPGRQATSAAE